jgi:flagellar assembly protein FliH
MSDLQFKEWHPQVLTSNIQRERITAENIKEVARSSGYKEGYEEGFKAGVKDAEEQNSKILRELNALKASFETPFKQQEQDVSDYLLSLLLAMCKTVLKREISSDPTFVKDTLDAALSLLASSESSIQVAVHPEDKQLVEQHWTDTEAKLVLTEDATMIRGGCRVERGDSLVDASIEKQCAQIITQMLNLRDASSDDEREVESASEQELLMVSKKLEASGDE